jgi:hypothetical protein
MKRKTPRRSPMKRPGLQQPGGYGTPEIDLGTPPSMVGMSALQGGCGGVCPGCSQLRSVLLADGKCVQCSSSPPGLTGIPQHPRRRG